jgi:hypothetical protein
MIPFATHLGLRKSPSSIAIRIGEAGLLVIGGCCAIALILAELVLLFSFRHWLIDAA